MSYVMMKVQFSDGTIGQRAVDHWDNELPGSLRRAVPVLADHETVLWRVGAECPLIINVKEPNHD